MRPGVVVEFCYPAANYRGVPRRLERRRVRVSEVRHLDVRPLDCHTVVINPRLRRGSVLVTGFDLDKQEERSFYLESMRDVEVQPADPAVLGPFAVVWIETDEPCHGDGDSGDDFPDEFRIVEVVTSDLPRVMADAVADGANLFAVKAGLDMRAIVVPPGWLDSFAR